MKPLLKQGRDLVTVRPVTRPLKKYDVPLYRSKRDGRQVYVLHRIVKVLPNGYVIRGDNTYFDERGVTDADIVGVMTAFKRKGKDVSVESRAYKAYVRIWCFVYPLRKLVRPVYSKLRKAL